MSTPSTTVVADKLQAAATKLRDLVDDADMKVFGVLTSDYKDLEAGKFDSAVWLEALVQDRLRGIDEHGKAMKKALDDLADKLDKIADLFRKNDDANAASLQGEAYDIITTWADSTADLSIPKAEEARTTRTTRAPRTTAPSSRSTAPAARCGRTASSTSR